MFCLRGNMYAKTGGMRWSWIGGGGSGNSRCKGKKVLGTEKGHYGWGLASREARL